MRFRREKMCPILAKNNVIRSNQSKISEQWDKQCSTDAFASLFRNADNTQTEQTNMESLDNTRSVQAVPTEIDGDL
jgi:hypothetical protein